jgi:hypothetical protein
MLQALVLAVGYGFPEGNSLTDQVVEVRRLHPGGTQPDSAAAADLLRAGEAKQLLQQVFQTVQLRGHRAVCRASFLGHVVVETVCA